MDILQEDGSGAELHGYFPCSCEDGKRYLVPFPLGAGVGAVERRHPHSHPQVVCCEGREWGSKVRVIELVAHPLGVNGLVLLLELVHPRNWAANRRFVAREVYSVCNAIRSQRRRESEEKEKEGEEEEEEGGHKPPEVVIETGSVVERNLSGDLKRELDNPTTTPHLNPSRSHGVAGAYWIEILYEKEWRDLESGNARSMSASRDVREKKATSLRMATRIGGSMRRIKGSRGIEGNGEVEEVRTAELAPKKYVDFSNSPTWGALIQKGRSSGDATADD